MIRAVMICDYRNPISVAYSKIALKTWKPVKNVEGLANEPFDILINLDPDTAIPIDFFVAMSKAKMKVSNHSSRRKKDYDILLPPAKGDTWKQRNHRIIKFLSESPLS